MNNANYTVLATSQEDDRTMPNTNGQGRPIGSQGRGYTVLAEGSDSQSGQLQKSSQGDAREFRGASETIDRISNAYNEPVTQNVPNILKPTASVAEGIVDFTLGAGAGVNDMFAGLINMFDDENAAADFLTDGANRLRAKQFKSKADDGIMSDAGQLAGNEVAGAYTGGKAADALLGSAKLVSKAVPIYKNAKRISGGNKYQDLSDKTGRQMKADSNIVVKNEGNLGPNPRALENMTKESLEPLILSVLPNKFKNKISGITDEFLQWLPIVGKKAGAREFEKAVSELARKYDISKVDATELFESLTMNAVKNSPKAKQTAIDALFKSPSKTGSAIGALFGSQSNDNK